jgi:superfamily II DNA or RNA helicase
MLPRQPLRFLLADDPGAGKTIMAGLLVKELILRGDLQRCLVVVPGSLVEQWQEELGEKFGIEFEILTRDKIEASRIATRSLRAATVCGSRDLTTCRETRTSPSVPPRSTGTSSSPTRRTR